MLLVTTAPGLEEFLAREIESIGRIISVSKGRVFLGAGIDRVPRINYLSALAHRVFIILKEFEIPLDKGKAFEIIEREVYSIPREDRLDPERPFAIRGSRSPKDYPHPFRSVDLGYPAGSAVIRRIRDKLGKRIPVNLKNPAYEIFVEVIERKARVMINTTGESLHKRGYRIRGHPASLGTTIARFMTRLADISEICDPMCGSGTIPIEARLEYQGVPIGRIRSKTYGWLWLNLKPLKDYRLEDPGNARRSQELFFSDRSSKHLDSAIANSFSASKLSEAPIGYRIVDLAKFRLADILELELSCKTIITNPPYGLRLGNPESVEPVYKRLFELDRKNLVLITPRGDLIAKYAPEPRSVYNVLHGDLPVKVYLF